MAREHWRLSTLLKIRVQWSVVGYFQPLPSYWPCGFVELFVTTLVATFLSSLLWSNYPKLSFPLCRATSLSPTLSSYISHEKKRETLSMMVGFTCTDFPRLMMGLCPDEPIVNWKCCKSEIHVIHLICLMLQISQSHLESAQNTRISLHLGKIISHKVYFRIQCRIARVIYWILDCK